MNLSRGERSIKEIGRMHVSRRRRSSGLKNNSINNKRHMKIRKRAFNYAPSSRNRYSVSVAKFHRGQQYYRKREMKRKYDYIRKNSYKMSRGRRFHRGWENSPIHPLTENIAHESSMTGHNGIERYIKSEAPSVSPTNISPESDIFTQKKSQVPKPEPVSRNILVESEVEEGQIIDSDDDDGISITGEYETLSEVSSKEEFDDLDDNKLSNQFEEAQSQNFDDAAYDEERMRETFEEYSENDANKPRSIGVLQGGHAQGGDTSFTQTIEEEKYFSSKGSRSLKPIPICFSWNGSTELERSRIASEMMRIVMDHGGNIKDEDLKRCLSEKGITLFQENNEFINFLLSHENNFEIYYLDGNTDQLYVKCKTNLKLCPAYLAHAYCDESCEGLHACKFHILSCCDNGKSCPYEHMIYKLRHNKKVLENHFLQKLNFTMIRRLLRDPTNRSITTVPKACSHYNFQNGCKNVEGCQYLHICKYKMYGDCKFGSSCKRSHDLFDRHNKKVLEKYGFEDGVEESLIGKLVREMFGKSLQSNASTDNKMPSKLDQVSTWEMGISGGHYVGSMEGIEKEYKNDINIVEQDLSNDVEMEKSVFHDDKSNVSASSNECFNGSSSYTWKIQIKKTNMPLELCQRDTENIEHMYKRYLQSRFHVVQINGERYTLDFSTLSGRRDIGDDNTDDGNDVILKRLMKESIGFIPLESP